MKQQVRFCTSQDGVRIAYGILGSGPPLVKAANYLTQLEAEESGPVCNHWLRGLVEHHCLIQYDDRGSGLSDWAVDDFSLAARVRDLEAVIEAVDETVAGAKFPLLGIAQGVPVAIAYAAQHPEKVSRLILYGGYARGRFQRDRTAEAQLQAETLINVIRVGWGKENPAFRQLFTTQLMPEGTETQQHWLNEVARNSATPENAAAMEAACYQIDVTDRARQVMTPTLILHGQDDAAVPFEEGRILAGLIPNARFVPLDSRNHILLEEEPAWSRFLAEVHAFLGAVRPERAEKPVAPQELFPELTPRELDILDLIAQGIDNETIAQELTLTEKTVRNYVSRIYSKMYVDRRAEVIVLAREAGLGQSAH